MKNLNAIKRFLSKDEIRPALHNFYVNDGKIYATSAYHMVVTPSELPAGCYDRNLITIFPSKVKGGITYYKDAKGNEFKRPDFENVLKSSYGKEQTTFDGCNELLEKVGQYNRKDLKGCFFRTKIGVFNAIYLKDIADVFGKSKNVTCTIGQSYGRSFAPIFDDGMTKALIMPLIGMHEDSEWHKFMDIK